MKNSYLIITLLFVVSSVRVSAQEFFPLWPSGKMPNSKGMNLTDSIFDERYRRVGTPGIYAFFPSKQENKNTSVILSPGGGYHHYAYMSTFQVAKWLNTLGINAFVLISRLPLSPDLVERSKVPLQDAQRAIRQIRSNAQSWNINPNKIGIMGFSAGAHVASTLGTHLEDVSAIGDELDKIAFNPNFMMLISPVITMGDSAHQGSKENLLGEKPSKELIEKYSSEKQVTTKTPPAFIVVAENDKVVPPINSILFFNALQEKKVSASLHVFPQGGHGIGMQGNPGSTKLWRELCEMWMIEMGFISN